MLMWLVKSEPETYSWANMLEQGTTAWDGVRNFQATAYLRKMQPGDRCFFYHSGSERQIVGIITVIQAFYPDLADPRFGMVDVKAGETMHTPVTLAAIKAEAALQHLALVRQSRLSVMPIDADSWQKICAMGKL
ncbi:MAG: EVE domain-containing protein [Alphaproteobacteria bacterium]